MTDTSPTFDGWEPVAALEDHGMPGRRDEAVELEGDLLVPMTCHGCGRPAYYDTADDRYHHATDPDVGCFLIPGEDRPPWIGHPLIRLEPVARWADTIFAAGSDPHRWALAAGRALLAGVDPPRWPGGRASTGTFRLATIGRLLEKVD